MPKSRTTFQRIDIANATQTDKRRLFIIAQEEGEVRFIRFLEMYETSDKAAIMSNLQQGNARKLLVAFSCAYDEADEDFQENLLRFKHHWKKYNIDKKKWLYLDDEGILEFNAIKRNQWESLPFALHENREILYELYVDPFLRWWSIAFASDEVKSAQVLQRLQADVSTDIFPQVLSRFVPLVTKSTLRGNVSVMGRIIARFSDLSQKYMLSMGKDSETGEDKFSVLRKYHRSWRMQDRHIYYEKQRKNIVAYSANGKVIQEGQVLKAIQWWWDRYKRQIMTAKHLEDLIFPPDKYRLYQQYPLRGSAPLSCFDFLMSLRGTIWPTPRGTPRYVKLINIANDDRFQLIHSSAKEIKATGVDRGLRRMRQCLSIPIQDGDPLELNPGDIIDVLEIALSQEGEYTGTALIAKAASRLFPIPTLSVARTSDPIHTQGLLPQLSPIEYDEEDEEDEDMEDSSS